MHSEHLRITEVNGVKPDKDHSGPSGALVGRGAIVGRSSCFPIRSISGSDTSDDEVGDGHADAADDENRLSAESVDVQNNTCCQQGDRVVTTLAGTETNALEDERCLFNKVSSQSTTLI
jgi:hypothetical protein